MTGTTTRLYGIVKFEEPLLCHKDLLGNTFPVCIGGVDGQLQLPISPIESGRPADPLREFLLPPRDAKAWKQGEAPIRWGRRYANQYPNGHPDIWRMLLRFDLPPEDVSNLSTLVHQNFKLWRTRFFEGLDLLSTRWLVDSCVIQSSQPEDLDLFIWNQSGKVERPDIKEPVRIISISSSKPDPALTHAHLLDACRLASNGLDLPEPYRFQLVAHRAIGEKDFRKAIVETAVASEIALTQTIEARLLNDNVSYAEKILKKFRMLSGRIDLAIAMGLHVPTDVKSHLVEPRNLVAHRGYAPSEEEAVKAVKATESILRANLPSIV